ncbi:MAG: hypothetical protein K2X48_11855 [Chitinophagaceae bacterium]|nr:hypothetical protein [Chitinophagaceae bacterium]
MKSLLFSLIFVSLISTVANAQITIPKAAPSVPGIGNLITQFTNQIKPSSFTNQWAGSKTNFLSNAGKVSNAVNAGKTIASLIGFLKPGMFRQGFNIQNLVSAANTAKNMSQVTGLLRNLEGGLQPEAFADSWSGERTNWLNALNLVK